MSELAYADGDLNVFVGDMKRAGIEVEHFKSAKSTWEGPAVKTENFQELTRKTVVRLGIEIVGDATYAHPIRAGKIIAADRPARAKLENTHRTMGGLG